MRKFLFLLLIVSVPVFSCLAQQPAAGSAAKTGKRRADLPPDAPSREQLLKLFGLLEVEQQVQAMKSMMHEIMKTQAPSLTQMSPRQQKELDQLESDLTDRVMGPEYIHAVMEGLIPLYQRRFTAADVDAVIRFYSSPAGQKFLHKQPEILQEFMPKVMAEAQQRLQTAMDEVHFSDRMRKIMVEDEEENPKKP